MDIATIRAAFADDGAPIHARGCRCAAHCQRRIAAKERLAAVGISGADVAERLDVLRAARQHVGLDGQPPAVVAAHAAQRPTSRPVELTPAEAFRASLALGWRRLATPKAAAAAARIVPDAWTSALLKRKKENTK